MFSWKLYLEYRKQKNDLGLFMFPQDKKRNHAWQKLVDTMYHDTRFDFKLTKWSQICQKHFTEDSIDKSSVLQNNSA